MIRRLFDEFDRDKDGMLSIREFSYMITDSDESAAAGAATKSLPSRSPIADLSDEEEDGIFAKQRGTTDLELFRKVNEILQETIPPAEGGAASRDSHSSFVQKEVRRFFQKHDPDGRGTVSEERFRSFCRRSGLQDRLTVAEVRRLVDKLRRRRPGKEKGVSLIDYEKLCRQLSSAGDSIPLSRSEGVLLRLQDACVASANAGRPFITLCTLVDPRLTGRISREELQHTAKMIDCPLTNAEIDAIKEISPEAFSSDGAIVDYKELNAIIAAFTSRIPSVFDNDLSRSMGSTRWNKDSTGSLPAYASPNRTTRTDPLARSQFSTQQDFGRSIITPAGFTVATPLAAGRDPVATGFNNRGSSSLLASRITTRPLLRSQGDIRRLQDDAEPESAFERKMSSFAERFHAAVVAKSKARGTPLPIHRLFEVNDFHDAGFISGRDFEGTLDDLGVLMNSTDLANLYSMFGRPEDDAVDYRAFSSWVMQYTPVQSPRALHDAPSYASPRVIQRLRDLRLEGRDPRDIFEIHDLNRTGTVCHNACDIESLRALNLTSVSFNFVNYDHRTQVNIKKFQDEICRLGLLQTEQQLTQAIDDFICISDRYRCYTSTSDLIHYLHVTTINVNQLLPLSVCHNDMIDLA
jgi:Ca2+-binding EF-hand superfamily protein